MSDCESTSTLKRESDEEYEETLPDYSAEGMDALGGVEVDFGKLLSGQTVELNIDGPEIVQTEGAKKSQSLRKRLIANALTWEKMKHAHLEGVERKQTMEAMFDYEEIEILMDNLRKDGSIKKLLIKPGTGRRVKAGDVVSVHFILSAEDLYDELVDSTYDRNLPIQYHVGRGECIEVMDVGLQTMRVGEISKFLGIPEVAFGRLGIPSENAEDGHLVPPDTRVLVQIEVINVYAEKTDDIICLTPAQRAEIPVLELIEKVKRVKQMGNNAYLEGKYDEAYGLYYNVYDCLYDMSPSTKEEAEAWRDLRYSICCNLGLTSLKQEKYGRALRFSRDVLTMKNLGKIKLAKPKYLMAKAHFAQGDYEDAFEFAKDAAAYSEDADVKDLLSKIERKLKENKSKDKELFQRMMGKQTTDDQKTQGSQNDKKGDAVTDKFKNLKL